VPDLATDVEMDVIVSALREKFVESAGAKLDLIDQALDGIGTETMLADSHSSKIKRQVHSLKGTAGSFGFMSITLIAEAFEEFLSAAELNGTVSASDAHLYFAAIRTIIDSGVEPGEDERARIMNALPAPAQSNAG